ncbi:tRNA epoxyqueuosine(34) reductase QueG [candidate division WOR-3 bacterium]|nr:tRNA epoxyqueuosine(34) reductase QueG [candidate division WOR-3 bacterium]
MIHTQDIKEQARCLGIDDLRITIAEPFDVEKSRFLEQKEAGLFIGRKHRHLTNIESFYDARSTLTNARSVLVACLYYITDEPEDLSTAGIPYGRIARYTWRNHYKDLRKRLERLAVHIATISPMTYVVFSNGPIAEKPLAKRSGIGFYGKHSIILHPSYGSWIVLGEIVTDLELEPDEPLTLECGDCRACIDACPTHAIKAPYIIDRTRCIQELTNWCGPIPEDIMEVWDNRLYGCTTCQEVCPYNKDAQPRSFQTDIGYVGSCIPLFEILTMNEGDYRTRFANNQITASWIHFKAIQRNALLALGHIGGRDAIPYIERYCHSSDTTLSHAAQWAHCRVTDA